MTTSLIPESAPFDTEQRAWLNGFFAGFLNMPGTDVQQAEGAVAMLTGNPLTTPASDEKVEEEDYDDAQWHDPGLAIDDRLALAEGKPKAAKLMAAMAQLDCGSCGYLCKSYSAAIATGEESNLTLCSPGGKETAKMLKKLIKESDNDSPAASTQAEKPVETGWSRTNPFPAKLVSTHNLNGDGSAKHTAHVVIELGDEGPTYEVGDALGVYPKNCPDLVASILQRLNATGADLVDSPHGGQAPFKMVLERDVNLSAATEELLDLLIGSTSANDEEAKLQAWLKDDHELDEMDVLDVLEAVPKATPDPSRLVLSLDPMNPRLYSIASSLKKHAGQVHLTVGRVSWTKAKRERKGVASTFFSDRCSPGEEIPVFVQKSHGFTVPADPTKPMIMVGPGTGIAPFRAFLEERAATAATGKNWLFFGDQKSSCDYLYEDELNEYLTTGLLSRIDTAFSRDQQEKIYVQHRMAEHGADLFQWLQEGGYFYVCGDASRMAVDVDNALHAVVAKHGGFSEAAAKEYVAALTKDGRYSRDVY